MNDSLGLFFAIVTSFTIVWFVGKMIFNLCVAVWNVLPESANVADDYWNDAGDGSGVNYVQMPDGSVRID